MIRAAVVILFQKNLICKETYLLLTFKLCYVANERFICCIVTFKVLVPMLHSHFAFCPWSNKCLIQSSYFSPSVFNEASNGKIWFNINSDCNVKTVDGYTTNEPFIFVARWTLWERKIHCYNVNTKIGHAFVNTTKNILSKST